MSELIVLGLVPGTHIQITFMLWLVASSILAIGGLVWLVRRGNLLRDWIIALHWHALIRGAELRA